MVTKRTRNWLDPQKQVVSTICSNFNLIIITKQNKDILPQSIAPLRYSQETTSQSFGHMDGLGLLQELDRNETVHTGTSCQFESNCYQDQ